MIVSISNNHWVRLSSNISRKNKKLLKRYWSKIYPRHFVNKMLATIEEKHVQSKEAKHGSSEV